MVFVVEFPILGFQAMMKVMRLLHFDELGLGCWDYLASKNCR